MLSRFPSLFCSALILVVVTYTASYAEPDVPFHKPGKIMDNSFLLEEAYNQEDGVIQHIQAFQYLRDSRSWGYTFTEEWPAPTQKHQVSLTLPVSHLDTPEKETGIGDILLNYRYQLVFKENIALAPRFSLILPTGDYKKGLGDGAVGYQANIPLSIDLSDKWVTHWNIGATFIPGSKEAGGAKADTTGFNYGTSFIYAPTNTFNFMIEAVWNSAESVQTDGSTVWEDSFIINPGMRAAFDFESGLQVVPGLAFPIGAGPSKGESGVFLYLSFEHPMF